MVSKFWKWATLYLVVGIFWGMFAVYKDAVAGPYSKGYEFKAPITLFVNTFIWSVTIPAAIFSPSE